jgi:hypothetical protein
MRHPAESPEVVLTSNGGSLSIKLAVYTLGQASGEPPRGLAGQLDRIGLPGTRLTVRGLATGQPVAAADQAAATVKI